MSRRTITRNPFVAVAGATVVGEFLSLFGGSASAQVWRVPYTFTIPPWERSRRRNITARSLRIMAVAAVVMTLLLSGNRPANAQVVLNPSFGQGLTDWTIAPGAYDVSTGVYNGNTSAALVKESGGGGIYQDVPVTLPAGTEVQLSYWFTQPQVGSDDVKVFTALLQPNGIGDIGVIQYQYDAVSDWTEEILSEVLPTNVTFLRVNFNTQDGNGSGNLGNAYVTNVSITSTPEPGGVAIFAALGACALGLAQWCRRFVRVA